uniref:Phosphotyrosine protein phosphatase I domain-containing protein n=1 Tax=Peromyscus maniculatus bairdii TaxID=230844 RepID=A0A8C8W3M6_PERMB
MAEHDPESVLFVCLGNICWPFVTEMVFRRLTLGENISHNWVVSNSAVPSTETRMEAVVSVTGTFSV